MTLHSGARFGAYEIVAVLGIGGMGEVYRARDTKLGRDVALKIIPLELAHQADRLARFEREARLLATLNHPHVAAIYGVEESAGVQALVLELVDGPTLADRLTRGPLPVPEAIGIARQIAEALDAAHERGIVHRDLKPANIKVTPDGVVKVLDFGLGKATAPEGGTDPTQSPTVTFEGTRAGVILGTAAYMSPEQARGQIVDRRTDIWAFGCVLFEMLTAKRAFAGDDVSDTLASVLRSEPDWSALPPAAAPIAGLLQRCLEKDRTRRLRDIADARLWLDDGRAGPPAAQSGARPRRAWGIAAAAALAGAGVGAWMISMRTAPTALPPGVSRFELRPAPADPVNVDTFGAAVAISPDGSRIVYAAIRNGVQELVVRRLDRLEATPLAGTEGAVGPAFSPDSRQIAFVSSGELKRMPIDGGPAVAICKVDRVFNGASWADDDTIVFTQYGRGLFRVRASGGPIEQTAAAAPSGDEMSYHTPMMLSPGRTVIYTLLMRNRQTRVVARTDFGRGPATVLVEGGFGASYLPSGHLVYAQGDRLMAVRFDADALRVVGSPVVVQDHLSTRFAEGVSNVSMASNGTGVYVLGPDADLSHMVWVDRHGARVAPVVNDALQFPRNLRISPDGRRIAVTLGPSGLGDIWVYDVAGAAQPLKLTFRDHNSFSIWSPDGLRLAFITRTGSTGQLVSLPADGSATQMERLAADDVIGLPTSWSPDGRVILIEANGIRTLHTSDRTVTPWLQTPFMAIGGVFSPNGRWVAYASDQTGTIEIWVRPYPGPGAPVRVSADGGLDPAWSRDGRELFYHLGTKVKSSRVVTDAPDFRADAPQTLFEGRFFHDDTDPGLRVFDVAADGRLLMIESANTGATSIVVAQHLDEELRRLLPVR